MRVFLGLFLHAHYIVLQHQSKSYVIAEEPHEVIQLDYSHKTLLISTMFRSILCTPGNTSAKQRLGKKDRKMQVSLFKNLLD